MPTNQETMEETAKKMVNEPPTEEGRKRGFKNRAAEEYNRLKNMEDRTIGQETARKAYEKALFSGGPGCSRG